MARRPEANPGIIPIFDINSHRHDSGLNKVLRYIEGAEAPESLAKNRFAEALGQQNKFQTLDPSQLSKELYGRSDEEKRRFLLMASEDLGITEQIRNAKTIEEAERIFGDQNASDKRKAIEEALTMKALSQGNPYITNIRRPPIDVKGKYDYLIDLPEHKGVPVDPKTVAPYIVAHWNNGKLTRAQSKQAEYDKERGVDPELPMKVALQIATSRHAEPPANYARWLVSNGNAQLQELTEIHESEEYKFKGIVVTNVAYIHKLEQLDLKQYKEDPRILEYFKLKHNDLERIIEVSPEIGF